MARLQVTVDDGPQPVNSALTPILDEVRRRGIVVAFFVIGEEVATARGAIRAMMDAGHVVGNHSWDHLKNGTSRYSDPEILEQFRRCHAEVSRAGLTMQHWRAPRLDGIGRLERILVRGSNPLYRFTHADVHADSGDSIGTSRASGMIENIRRDIRRQSGRNTFRLLFHVRDETAAALRAVLDALVGDGHVLEGFSQRA